MTTYEANIRVCHKCEHRRRPCAGACPCGLDGVDIIHHARAGDCSMGLHLESGKTSSAILASVPAPQPMVESIPYVRLVGAALWASIHTCEEPSADYVRSITAAVPCGECRGHWLKILAAHPPDFGQGWFAWTVMAHNLVNARLGKPELTIEAAVARWAPARHDRSSFIG